MPDISVDSIPYTYRIRTNCVTGMIFSPHIDFEHRYNEKWGWGIAAFARPISIRPYRLLENPDFQLTGFGGFADLIRYKPSWKGRYWTFGLRCGYRNLTGRAQTGNLSSPDYKTIRSRQDIVTAWRVSFVMPSKKYLINFDWYFTFGARTSFYKTRFFPLHVGQYVETAGFGYPQNGCYVLPEFTGGLEFGFGW